MRFDDDASAQTLKNPWLPLKLGDFICVSFESYIFGSFISNGIESCLTDSRFGSSEVGGEIELKGNPREPTETQQSENCTRNALQKKNEEKKWHEKRKN